MNEKRVRGARVRPVPRQQQEVAEPHARLLVRERLARVAHLEQVVDVRRRVRQAEPLVRRLRPQREPGAVHAVPPRVREHLEELVRRRDVPVAGVRRVDHRERLVAVVRVVPERARVVEVVEKPELPRPRRDRAERVHDDAAADLRVQRQEVVVPLRVQRRSDLRELGRRDATVGLVDERDGDGQRHVRSR
jgi:hypothetical protein